MSIYRIFLIDYYIDLSDNELTESTRLQFNKS